MTALSLVAVAALTACTPALGEGGDSPNEVTAELPQVPAVQLNVNLPRRGDVQVDQVVSLTAENGTLDKVVLSAQGGSQIAGSLSKNDTVWTADSRLEPGTTYVVKGVGVDSSGLTRKMSRTFSTVDLTLDQQTYPSIYPDGATVGVGMPVIAHFDVAVTDRAEIERNLSVTASPAQKGAWHWISGNEVHWRPKSYWKPGTDVTVKADVNSVNAGNGIFGQEDRSAKFHVGDALFMRTNLITHEMKVFRNGTLLRTIPVTGGKSGFTTRSGVKVIIEKFRTKRMNAATTGISESDPEYYDIENVEYAQRVTYSGEFIHAAPWSVGSQGYANVSHGCVGMSTDNAAWLYSMTKIGDVQDVTGTERPMESANGYGDWNLSWADYKAGSAL